MLTGISNFALVQFIQVVVFLFFVWVAFGIVRARIRLPKTKIEPVLDILMIFTILVYAVVLRIIFST